MSKLLFGLITLKLFITAVYANSNPTVCVVKENSKVNFFVSYMIFDIACNDGKSYKTQREAQYLYIPTGAAKKNLEKFIQDKGLKLVTHIQSYEKNKVFTPYENQLNFAKVLIYANDHAAKDWLYVRRNDGRTTGFNNVSRFDFHYTSKENNYSSVTKNSFTNQEFYNYFKSLGFQSVLSADNKNIFYQGTIHVFRK